MALETEMPVDLVLVRHGESEGNLYDDLMRKGKELASQSLAQQLQSKLHGRHSSEWRLTDLGRHQAKRAGMLVRESVLAKGVGSFDKFFVSSYARAMETAGVMDLPDAKYQVNVLLREKDSVREWNRSGVELTQHGADKESSKVSKFYGDAAGLETPADLLMRASLFLQHLRRQCCGQRVLVVCHNHIMKAFRIILTDVHPTKVEETWDEVTPNCCIEWYTRRDAMGNVRTHYNRRIVLALKDPKDPAAAHCNAAITEDRLRTSASEHELTSLELISAVAEKPQSLNNVDMKQLVASPNLDRPPMWRSASCPPVPNGVENPREPERRSQLEKIRQADFDDRGPPMKQTPGQKEIDYGHIPESPRPPEATPEASAAQSKAAPTGGLLDGLRRLCCRCSRGPARAREESKAPPPEPAHRAAHDVIQPEQQKALKQVQLSAPVQDPPSQMVVNEYDESYSV